MQPTSRGYLAGISRVSRGYLAGISRVSRLFLQPRSLDATRPPSSTVPRRHCHHTHSHGEVGRRQGKGAEASWQTADTVRLCISRLELATSPAVRESELRSRCAQAPLATLGRFAA